MDAFEAKMKADQCSDAAIAAFRHNYEQLVQGVTGMIDESEIDAVQARGAAWGGSRGHAVPEINRPTLPRCTAPARTRRPHSRARRAVCSALAGARAVGRSANFHGGLFPRRRWYRAAQR